MFISYTAFALICSGRGFAEVKLSLKSASRMLPFSDANRELVVYFSLHWHVLALYNLSNNS